MQNTPETPPPAQPANALLRTVLLAGAVFAAPILIGTLIVMVSQNLLPSDTKSADTATAALLSRLRDGSATTVAQLTDLRRDLRAAGLPTDEADIRLWAAHAEEPECLFTVPPPGTGTRWTWSLSQDGLYALAVSAQADTAARRTTGLYDLTADEWVWTNTLPWPDTHEAPYVFDRRTIVRYSKNDTRFALEIDRNGNILSIDKLGAGTVAPALPPRPNPFVHDATPVAVRYDVYFAADVMDGALRGYANRTLPGLRYAGLCDATTAFSGNGLMKFSVVTGIVTVADSLTHTVLQTYKAWPAESATAVHGMTASLDGSNLVVALTSMFAGTPPVERDWSMSIDLYSGKAKTDTGPQPPRPDSADSMTATSPDGKWLLAIDNDNELTVRVNLRPATLAPALADPIARIPLASLGLRAPIQSIAFLEGGRHLLIRQRADAWLLDFTVARSYAGLKARAATSAKKISLDTYRIRRETNDLAKADARLATSSEGYGIEDEYDADTFVYQSLTKTTAPSYLLMRAELLTANQAWGYAAATLEEAARLQKHDSRAPRINPLLLARCQFLSDQDKKARATCREALRTLLLRPIVHDNATGTSRPAPNIEESDNRMIRYHLQSLLFSK